MQARYLATIPTMIIVPFLKLVKAWSTFQIMLNPVNAEFSIKLSIKIIPSWLEKLDVWNNGC